MRKYKHLKEHEVNYYKSLSKSGIKNERDTLIKSMYHNNIPMNQIKLDEPFHVSNGDWDGVIYKELDRYYMNIFVELKGDSWIDKKDITEQYLNGILSRLDIKYIIDEKKYHEFYKIYHDKTAHLYGADENCEHEIEGGDNYSGIKCIHCRGWYCA